jgi:hypothetical protein
VTPNGSLAGVCEAHAIGVRRVGRRSNQLTNRSFRDGRTTADWNDILANYYLSTQRDNEVWVVSLLLHD